ncbi:MAG TPA: serine/threonine-protein kinase [Microthrixaceae bacterium]|nr:serine/threonine-protein kinase [Microthrixaceae bacterium]
MAEGRLVQDPTEVTRIGSDDIGGLSGTTLCGRYRLEQLIGAGGMAQVWEATDRVLGRRVAVKLLHPHLVGDEAFVQRFRAEAIAAARLSHPGIVGIYDTCSEGRHEAIVMELLDAVTLRRHLDEHKVLDADTTVRIGLRLLDALEAAHRAGLVHRDVKPSNILLCRDGRVKIADFGIAKADDQTELTQDGTLVGTATYLAPEQLLGDPVDGRTDLYSLGIVLYECLTGRVPFQGDNGAAVALARLHSDPLDPRRYRADVPPRVAEAVMRVLRRDPDQRPASAAALRAALLDTGVDPSPPPPEPTRQVARPEVEVEESFARSERRWLYPALFILLVASALTVAGLLLYGTTLDDTDPSTTTTAPVEAGSTGELRLAGATSHDPRGRGEPGENDELAPLATDLDDATSWRTETYEVPDFFGSKTGVGLGVVLEGRARVDRLRIDGSTNGWRGAVYVIDRESLDGMDQPDDLTPVATFTEVRGPLDVDLRDAARDAARTGRIVLVWITHLGDPVAGGGYRVEIAEVRVDGAGVVGE